MAVVADAKFIEKRHWFARIRHRFTREICGVAFAIDDRHVMTCAHVVDAAGAEGPGQTVFIDFPLLSGSGCSAEVLQEGWAAAQDTSGDTAIVCLAEPVPGLAPVPLRSLRSIDGHSFTCYGVPADYDDGIPADGKVGKAVGQEWVKLKVAPDLLVERGFSGAAVWSEQAGAVVAMLVTRDGPSRGRLAFALPVGVVADRHRRVGHWSPRMADALVTALDLDPHRDSHWGPRSRGVSKDSDGWLFSGRRRATAELAAWLTSGSPPRQRVVTGAPGSGKSAVVARLVTTSDRHYRHRVPGLDGNDPTVPPNDAFDVTFHATGRTVVDFVAHVADIADVEAEDLSSLLVAFDRRGVWPVIAVDALDESVEPKAMARALVDLAQQGARVLVGTRDHLIDELSDPDPMRVDESPFLEAADVEAYVGRLLEEANPAPQSVTKADVRELCQAAEGNFLVAQLVARALVLEGHASRPFPNEVRQAFARYLDALPNPKAARDLLLPLAYASGDGLPMDLWLTAVDALCPGYDRADVNELLDSPAASFLVTHLDAGGDHRYRLFHVALAETLMSRRHPGRDQGDIWGRWVAALPTGEDGRPSWRGAAAYLCQHGADHAAAAERFTELVEQPGYLQVGDLDRLLVHLGDSVEGVDDQRAVLRLGSHRARSLKPSPRSQLLALAAHHLGLASLAHSLVAHGQPSWTPCWAHRLGHPNQPLTGHSGPVNSVAIGEVGGRQVVVSGGDDATVRLWDATSGQPLGEPLTGHTDTVLSVALGQAGKRTIIVSGGEDGTVRLWDAATGQPLGEPVTGHTHAVLSAAIGQVEGRVAIVSADDDGALRLWDAVSRLPLGEALTGSSSMVRCVTLGQAGKRDVVVAGHDDGTVRRWDAVSGQPLGEPLTRHTGSVNAVAIGQAGERQVVVAGGEEGTVRFWDAVSGQPLGEPLIGHSDWVNSVALARTGERDVVVSGGDDGTVRLWDAVSGQPLGEPLTGHTGSVNAVAIGLVDGRQNVVSSGEDRTVRLWHAARPESSGKPLTGHTGWVNSIAMGHVNGRQVIVSGGDRTVRLWDPESGQPLGKPFTGHTNWVNSVAIGQLHGRPVIVSGGDRTVRLWDPETGQPLGKPLTGHTNWVLSVAIKQVSERLLAVSGGDDGTVRLWDVAGGEPVGGPLIGHTGCVNSVAIGRAAGRDVIVSGSDDDGTLRLWDAATGVLLGESLTGDPGWVVSVALRQIRGRDVVLSGGDHRVRLWDLVPGQHPDALDLIEQPESVHLVEAVKAVAMDDEGNVFVASGRAICAIRPRSSIDSAQPQGR